MPGGLQISLIEVTDVLNSLFWNISFVLVIGLGIAFFVKLRGRTAAGLRNANKIFKKDYISMRNGNPRVTSLETFCISLGTRIGIGNIAGVATAIVTGGPGAVFWMWIFAIIGSASSFMESTLAQLYKEPKANGGFYGGPAYYTAKGLKNKKLGIFIAALTFVTFGMGFVAVQSANASSALDQAFDFDLDTLEFAILITGITTLIICSGVKGSGKFYTAIVPIMSLGWIVFAAISILPNIGNIGNAFGMIFQYAFSIESLAGGGLGAAVMVGLRRGIFSNEAGLGSLANIAATADIKHPAEQGLLQALGVLCDTLIICTVTALVILTFGPYEDILALGQSGAPLVQTIIASTSWGGASEYIIAGFMSAFALTSLIGYYMIAEANIRFISDSGNVMYAVRASVLVIAFVSALHADIGLVDSICDTLMAVTAGVNIVVVAMLSGKAYACYKDYMAQKKAGIKVPVFHSSVLGEDDGITSWK